MTSPSIPATTNPASTGAKRIVNNTVPSASVCHRTDRASRWRTSINSSGSEKRRYRAISLLRSLARVVPAISKRSPSFSGVAERVNSFAFVNEISRSSSAVAIWGSARRQRPTRIHSLAVRGAISNISAIHRPGVEYPAAAHSALSAKSAASATTIDWSSFARHPTSTNRCPISLIAALLPRIFLTVPDRTHLGFRCSASSARKPTSGL